MSSAYITRLPELEELQDYATSIWLISNNNGVFYAPKLSRSVAQYESQRPFPYFSNAKNLIDVWIGAYNASFKVTSWNPTNVLADTTKKAQLIDNIKNHILARVSDATGGTQLVFAVSTNMYNNIASEQIEWQGETMSLADAFLTKNWLLAGA